MDRREFLKFGTLGAAGVIGGLLGPDILKAAISKLQKLPVSKEPEKKIEDTRWYGNGQYSVTRTLPYPIYLTNSRNLCINWSYSSSATSATSPYIITMI
jgi:hypothetical protein